MERVLTNTISDRSLLFKTESTKTRPACARKQNEEIIDFIINIFKCKQTQTVTVSPSQYGKHTKQQNADPVMIF